MSTNTKLWVIAVCAAIVGALLGAGAVWAMQQPAVARLTARAIKADADTQAALQEADEARAELEDIRQSAAQVTSSATEPTDTAGVTTDATKKPVKTVKQFTFVKKVNETGSATSVVADYAQILTGDAAADAAAANGDESPPPNDYYILNTNKLLRTLKVKPGINVSVATNEDGTSDPDGHDVSLSEWADYFAAPTSDNAGIRKAPYWIWVKGDTIVKIEQQYLP